MTVVRGRLLPRPPTNDVKHELNCVVTGGRAAGRMRQSPPSPVPAPMAVPTARERISQEPATIRSAMVPSGESVAGWMIQAELFPEEICVSGRLRSGKIAWGIFHECSFIK